MLTSFDTNSFKKVGFSKPISTIVMKQAKLIKAAKLDGIVCSGYEAKKSKRFVRIWILLLGIRLTGDHRQDQKRVMIPKMAFENGATGIVIGRSITKGNIKNNFKKLIYSLS